jgi:23S rRNA pseudoU1915 N3-methylase RlmH
MSWYQLILGLLAWCLLGPVVAAEKTALPQPDPVGHRQFLLRPYQPAAPSVVVFKDPFCGYCIKAMANSAQLAAYNVYLFWYPIFGTSSEERVQQFFRCQNPTGPLVQKAMLARQAPACDGDLQQQLAQVNQQMVDAYLPDAVPAYYLSGQRTYAAELVALQQQKKPAAQVKVQWQRYRSNLVTPATSGDDVAVFLPATAAEQSVSALLATLASVKTTKVYLFAGSAGQQQQICQLQAQCQQLASQGYNAAEARLLFGLSTEQYSVVLNGSLVAISALPVHLQFLPPQI